MVVIGGEKIKSSMKFLIYRCNSTGYQMEIDKYHWSMGQRFVHKHYEINHFYSFHSSFPFSDLNPQGMEKGLAIENMVSYLDNS